MESPRKRVPSNKRPSQSGVQALSAEAALAEISRLVEELCIRYRFTDEYGNVLGLCDQFIVIKQLACSRSLPVKKGGS